jgi:DNA topoisomerase I
MCSPSASITLWTCCARPGALRELGEHPAGGKISVMGGKFGAYVKHEKTNATIPKEMTPETITLEQAIALIVERGGKSVGKKKAAKKVSVKKPAAKKAATKKIPKAKIAKAKEPEAA